MKRMAPKVGAAIAFTIVGAGSAGIFAAIAILNHAWWPLIFTAIFLPFAIWQMSHAQKLHRKGVL
jgi:hypothetical protein